MALARRHDIGLEMAVYRLAVLIGKNRSEAALSKRTLAVMNWNNRFIISSYGFNLIAYMPSALRKNGN